jgi:DNA-binding SARP family transcriptional activator
LLALLALRGNMVHRALVAGQLWSEVTERRAHSSAPGQGGSQVVVIGPAEVGLTDGVTIDLRESRALADRLLTPGGCPDADDCSARAVGMLSTDLLPGWDEDWASCEAEQWHQVRMHALEAMAHLVGMGRFGAAVESAMWAIRADPFRESGHAALIRVHLAEGNQSEALRQFATYRELIVDELGLEPTPRLRALVFSSR